MTFYSKSYSYSIELLFNKAYMTLKTRAWHLIGLTKSDNPKITLDFELDLIFESKRMYMLDSCLVFCDSVASES